MATGRVEAIFTGSVKFEPLERSDEVEVLTGGGIRGDRYGDTDGDLTLFEAEAIEGLLADTGIELQPNEIRRNVMTRGVSLNDLVGRRFRVGEVEAFGTERCDPCEHLQKMTKPGVLRGLVDRGGLNADVVRGGVIRVGDELEDLGPVEHPSSEGGDAPGRAEPSRSE